MKFFFSGKLSIIINIIWGEDIFCIAEGLPSFVLRKNIVLVKVYSSPGLNLGKPHIG